MNAVAAGQVGPVFNPRENTNNGAADYFFYLATPVAALSTVTPNAQSLIQFDADSQFAWLATSYQALITVAPAILGAVLTEATNVIPLALLNIQDGGSGKYLMNAPVPLGAIAGDGKRPYRMIGPRIFQPSATVNINWTNGVVAGTNYTIYLVFHGVKLYN